MKNQTVSCKKGALLVIALFLIVGIAAVVPFLMHSSETAGERAKYSDEWNKIQWAVSGIKNKHIEKGVKTNFYSPYGNSPYGNSTVATISYGDFHVSVNVSERKTMLDKNSCFYLTPSVYRGASQPYADGGYDLSDYAVTSNSAPGVAAGANHSFCWKKDGSLYAWGYNNKKQLGTELSGNYASLPNLVKQGSLFTQGDVNYFNQGWLVAGGSEISLAVDYSGNAYAWGKVSENNVFFNLFLSDGIANTPTAFNASDVLDIACGNGFFALLTSDRKIKYSNWNSKFGKDSSFSEITGLSGINGISGNKNHLLAITSNGDLWGFGSNAAYQLGRSDTSINYPVKINDSEVGLVSQVLLENSNKLTPSVDSKFYISSAYNLATFTVTANAAHRNQDPDWPWTTYKDYIFLDSDDNNENDRLLFVNTSTHLGGGKYLWEYAQDTTVKADTYTVKLMTEKTSWGGFLGLKKKEEKVSIPERWYKNNTEGSPDHNKGVYSFHGSVASVTGFIGVAAGGDFSLALKIDGDKTVLYSWGTNTHGQLGLGNNNTAQNMTQVPNFPPTNEELRSVSAGAAHALALTKCGTKCGKVYAWGDNQYGQLGLNSTETNRNVPTPVTALDGKKIISIAAGDNHSLAMDEDFNVYSWGRNNYGQLGLSDKTNRNTPIPVSGL